MRRSKLQPKSTPCIFVGYSLEAKAYRLYDPITKKMHISRNVAFMEDQVCKIESDYSNIFPNLVVEVNGDDVNSVEELNCELPSNAAQELANEIKDERLDDEVANASTDSMNVEYDVNSEESKNFEDAFEEQHDENSPEVRHSDRIVLKSTKNIHSVQQHLYQVIL